MKNAVKEKLARGELVASMIVRLVSGVEIVRIAKSAGFDALYIDLEHSSLTPESISRVLDGGALGIIAPGVQSADEARAVLAAAKYPPSGRRGFAPGLPPPGYPSGRAAEGRPAPN